jgi:glycosyltransferase involved in cell wall biosynthesis
MFLGDLAGTGFGTVTQDLGRALLDLGHDVRFVSQNELGDLPEPFGSRTLRVNSRDGWLSLVEGGGVAGLLDGSVWPDSWVPEAAILLGDFFAARLVIMANEASREAFRRVPTLHYVPIEGVDLPAAWREAWGIVHPVAMSEFGADQIEIVTGTRPPMIYHGVDAGQFRPVSGEHPLWIEDHPLRSRADCKKLFGGDPRQRWVLRTDRHMPRKRYPSLLRAMAPVMATRPDVYLVMHCRSDDQGGHLPDSISKYPERIASRMLITGFHDQMGGASRDILTALYNAADVYASVSAEGFGLTIAEAIACGTPAVGLDYSAVPEVIGPAGIAVPIGGLVDNEYDHFWAAADEPRFGNAVASLLDDDLLRKRLGQEGPRHVRANFQWPQAALKFSAAIRDRIGVAA